MKSYLVFLILLWALVMGAVAGSLVREYGGALGAWTVGDPIPPLYRAENGALVKNFEYGDVVEPRVAYKSGEYSQSILNGDFKADGYHLPTSATPSGSLALSQTDPFLMTEISIQNMEVIQFIGSANYLLIIELGEKRLYITYAWAHLRIYYTNKVYSTIPVKWDDVIFNEYAYNFFVEPSENSSNLNLNYLSFKLEAVQSTGQIRYTIANSRGYSRTDILPDMAQKYDNSSASILGVTNIDLQRTHYYKHSYYKNDWDKFWGIKSTTSKTFSATPNITIGGVYAKVQKAVDCYIDGALAFTDNMFLNHWQRPNVPSMFDDPYTSFEWFTDPHLTQGMVYNQVMARNFDALYAMRINKSFDVTLEYFTLDRFYTSANGGMWYEALVEKSVTRLYEKDSVIDLGDFGADVYYTNFYDNIQRIPFLNWDTDISAPITAHTVIRGNYKFPTATLRYFDVDNKLYGTVTQDMTMFPIDLLKAEIDRLETSNPDWWKQDKTHDTGAVGALYRVMESVARFLFGGDNVGNGKWESLRTDEKQMTKVLVNQIAMAHVKGLNEYFLPVVYLDINLENLNKGAHGNASFYINDEQNPQWHLVSGSPLRNDLVYFADVHSMYTLQNANFTMVVNFEKKQDGFDALSLRIGNIFAWVGGLFGGIWGGLDMFVWVVIGVLLLIFCFPLVVATIKGVVSLVTFPIRWIGKRLGST